MKHRQKNQLEALQAPRRHRAGLQPIERQSWEPITQPARHRQRTADPAFKRVDSRDLEIYERHVGKWLDRFSAKQHRSFDAFPAQLERLFADFLAGLPVDIRQSIERVISK